MSLPFSVVIGLRDKVVKKFICAEKVYMFLDVNLIIEMMKERRNETHVTPSGHLKQLFLEPRISCSLGQSCGLLEGPFSAVLFYSVVGKFSVDFSIKFKIQ